MWFLFSKKCAVCGLKLEECTCTGDTDTSSGWKPDSAHTIPWDAVDKLIDEGYATRGPRLGETKDHRRQQ